MVRPLVLLLPSKGVRKQDYSGLTHVRCGHVVLCPAQVPSDASIVLSVMQQERAAQMAVAVSPPTLNTDLPHQANSGEWY